MKHILLPLLVSLVAAMTVFSSGCRETKPDSLSEEVKSGPLSLGDIAPEFTLPSADGQLVSLSDFKGKNNVLLFFHMAYG